MAELREVRVTGPVIAGAEWQTPEIVAKISERSCPVGWELELVQAAGQTWGYCCGCGRCWRLRKGAVESVGVWGDPRTPMRGMRPDQVIVDEAWQDELAWRFRAASARPETTYLEWRETPDGPGVPLAIEPGSLTVKWAEGAAEVTADQADRLRSAWLSARQWGKVRLLPPGEYLGP